MGAHRQKAMCATRGGQGQSLNLYIEADESEEETRPVLIVLMRTYSDGVRSTMVNPVFVSATAPPTCLDKN